MENTGSAIVDFGRFMTGFLVVMGIGAYKPLPPILNIRLWLEIGVALPPTIEPGVLFTYSHTNANVVTVDSSPNFTGTLCPDLVFCDDHVYHRRPIDIWDDHKFHNVLSGRAGILRVCRSRGDPSVLLEGWRTVANLYYVENLFQLYGERTAMP